MYTLYVIYINAACSVLPEMVDDLWIFIEFGRSIFVGVVEYVCFLAMFVWSMSKSLSCRKACLQNSWTPVPWK